MAQHNPTTNRRALIALARPIISAISVLLGIAVVFVKDLHEDHSITIGICVAIGIICTGLLANNALNQWRQCR